MARPLAGLISVAALARQMGVSRRTALRRLRAIDRQAGGGVLVRFGEGRGSRMFTTMSLLRKADAKLFEDQALLREDVDELKARIDAQREVIVGLRHRVKRLETKVGGEG